MTANDNHSCLGYYNKLQMNTTIVEKLFDTDYYSLTEKN